MNRAKKGVRFIEFNFSTIEARNNYMKDLQKQREIGREGTLEDNYLKDIYDLVPTTHIVPLYALDVGYGHAKTTTSTLSVREKNQIKKKINSGDLECWHRTKHTIIFTTRRFMTGLVDVLRKLVK